MHQLFDDKKALTVGDFLKFVRKYKISRKAKLCFRHADEETGQDYFTLLSGISEMGDAISNTFQSTLEFYDEDDSCEETDDQDLLYDSLNESCENIKDSFNEFDREDLILD